VSLFFEKPSLVLIGRILQLCVEDSLDLLNNSFAIETGFFLESISDVNGNIGQE